MHGVEDIFPLNADVYAEARAFRVQNRGDFAERNARFLDIHEHDHGEHAAQNGLGDVEDVDIDGGESNADARDDAHAVVADDGDDGMHDNTDSIHNSYIRFGEFNTMEVGKQRRGVFYHYLLLILSICMFKCIIPISNVLEHFYV